MIELAFLVLLAVVMVVPTVLYHTLSDQLERPFWVQHEQPLPGGPYRGGTTQVDTPFEMPSCARGALAFSFLFSVLGLLMTMPVMIGVLCGWGGMMLMGLPGLLMALTVAAVGVKILRQGPGAVVAAATGGLAQVMFGAWVLAVVVTVTDAQSGPVAGLIEESVAAVLYRVGGRLREDSWAVPFSVRGGLGILPVLYATASMMHGALLLASARSFAAVRSFRVASAR